jgi:uncharacterized membrane protein
VLDAARGLALVGMMIFHLCWDLAYFDLTPDGFTQSGLFHGFGHSIATAFVILVGIGLTLAARDTFDLHKALMRIGKITMAALLVSAATYVIFPDAWIAFGILHLIALASLLSLPLMRISSGPVVALAVAALTLPLLVSEEAFDSPALQWLGLGTHPPLTNDWRPLMPWFGVMLLGLVIGRHLAMHGLPGPLQAWTARNMFGRTLVLGGRHSLLIYLVHQPVLFALVFVGASLVSSSRTEISGSQSQFMSACGKQCVTTGGEASLCTRACGCIAQEASAQGMGRAVARNQLSPDEQIAFNDITKACLRRLLPQPPAP